MKGVHRVERDTVLERASFKQAFQIIFAHPRSWLSVRLPTAQLVFYHRLVLSVLLEARAPGGWWHVFTQQLPLASEAVLGTWQVFNVEPSGTGCNWLQLDFYLGALTLVKLCSSSLCCPSMWRPPLLELPGVKQISPPPSLRHTFPTTQLARSASFNP